MANRACHVETRTHRERLESSKSRLAQRSGIELGYDMAGDNEVEKE